MKLDSAHLELLAALQAHRTMTSASEAINLSPSAASRRLQDAERRLGVKLVDRHGRALQLTSAGRLLAEIATRTTREIAEAEFAARWLAAGEESPVRVGVGFFDQLGWLLPADYPVEVIRSPSPRAGDALDAHLSIDAFGVGQPAPSSILLKSDRLVLVTGRTHPLVSHAEITAVDLNGHRYLASRLDPMSGFEFESFFQPSGHGPTMILRVESFAMALHTISSGNGVSIQPRHAVINLGRDDLHVCELDRTIEIHWRATAGEPRSSHVDPLLEALLQSETKPSRRHPLL